MNTKQQRAAVLAKAQGILTSAEGRDFTAAEVKSLESYKTEIAALDVKIAAEDEGARLRASIGGMGVNDRPGDAKGTQHLNFRGLGARMAESMRAVSTNTSPSIKGLVPGGETIVPVPIVNSEPVVSTGIHERAPRLLDLLPVTVRSAAIYSILRQAVVANPGTASVVAPGDLKPTKKLGVARADSRLRVVAVLSEAIDKYLLEDASNLKQWVGSELADAIQDALELQILSGNGAGENFQGLATASGIQTQAFDTDRYVTLAGSLAKLQNLGLTPSFVALSAADALAIQTTRNAQGAFELGGVVDAAARTLWGTRWAVVPGLATGDAYVVADDSVGLSTDNAGVRVEWGTPGENFQRNQITARVEGRFNLDIMKPHGVVKTRLIAA